MEVLDFVCFGPIRNPRAIRTFHGGTCETPPRSPRSRTSRLWPCLPFVSMMGTPPRPRRLSKTAGLSKSTSDAYSRGRAGRTSRRSRDTTTTAGSLRATPSTASGSRRNTSRITSGFPCGQGACPRGALTTSAASSGVVNIFFLHQ